VVIAKVKSANEFGESDYSQPNTLGATIRTEPQKVKGLEYLPLESNDFTLSIKWLPLVTAVERGNEDILTYHLLWDEGTNGANWYDVQGQESIPSLTTAALIMTEHLVLGNTYKFKVRALNNHGWSVDSDIMTVMHSFVTVKPNPPTVTMENLFVKIAW